MLKRTLTYPILYMMLWLAPEAGLAQEEIFVLERAGFSSRAYDEHAPFLYQGSIVFTANKRISYTTQRTDANNKTAFNLFRVQQVDDENWTEPQLFSDQLSSVTAHHGWATYNSRGNRVFFNTNQDRVGNEDARVGIFTAGFVNGEWTGIQPFAHNDPGYNFFHPYLSPDETMLFFASNLPGGFGGFDLYVSVLDRSTWSEPINLGPLVNTRRNEIYPVYHDNGRLYFSSNEHPGIGGYDIFYTEQIGNQWIAPVHLPAPFNTRRNEACFISLDTAYTTGLITSNRDRTRTNSIYEFKLDIPESLFINCKQLEENNYCFTFYESGTMDIDTTNFVYEWLIEGKRFRTEEVDYCFAGPGQYQVQLNVIDMLSGAVMFNEASYDFEIEDVEQAYISSPDTVLVNENVVLDGTETFLKDFVIGRYVWNTGDLSYVAESVVSHAFNKPGIYTIRLGVLSTEENPDDTRHTCTYKRLVVLPQGQAPVSSNE
jgi:hypothetical protein